jgi:hypothetical protein
VSRARTAGRGFDRNKDQGKRKIISDRPKGCSLDIDVAAEGSPSESKGVPRARSTARAERVGEELNGTSHLNTRRRGEKEGQGKPRKLFFD